MYDKSTRTVILGGGRRIELRTWPAPPKLEGRGDCYRIDEPEGCVVIAVDPAGGQLLGVQVERMAQLGVLMELFREIASQGFGLPGARTSGVMRAHKADEEAPWTPRVPTGARRRS